jgi:hypothetical protein
MTEGWGCPELAKRKKAERTLRNTERSEQKMSDINDVENARNWINETCHCAHMRAVIGRALEYSEAVERAGLNPIGVTGQDLHEFLTDERVRSAFVKSFPQPTL